ncbi:MAG: SEL1-like repeat protein [Rhizobiales bacterium]|nr:SEL1-like repeat protein [Hyphomicrobiales bacterium]
MKGVDHDAREAAKEAARRSGLSLGEWLNTVIADQAVETGTDDADPGMSTVTRRLETITERLDAANRRVSDTAIPRSRLAREDSTDIVRALGAVARLAEISERRSAAAIEAVEQLTNARNLPSPNIDPAPRAQATQRMETNAQRMETTAQRGDTALSRPEPSAQPVESTAPLATRAADSSPQAQLDEIARSIRAMNAGVAAGHAAERASHTPPRLFDQDLDATVAEIAARQRALDFDAPEALSLAVPLSPAGFSRDVAQAERHVPPQPQPGLGPLAERLDLLGRRMDQILKDPLPREAGPDRAAITAEIQKLSQRIDVVNRRPSDGLERELKALSGRIEAMRKEMAARETAQADLAVADLRADIAQLAARLDDLAPRRAVETLEAEIHALGDRVATVRAQGIPAEALEHLVAEFERTVTSLTPAEGIAEELKAISRKLDMVKVRGADDANLDRLTDEILSVRELVAGAATRDAVEALADQVATLADRLENVVPARSESHAEAVTAAIEARIEEIADRLERASRRPGPAVAAAINPQLEEALRRLADKLEESHSRAGDPKVLVELEKHILSLAAKIDASDARFTQLGTIERGLSDLFVQMEEMRSSTIDAAERAARGAVADLGKSGRAPNAQVDALKSDIDSLRTAQAANEERTLGSLEAVHQTLERVVRRISELDPAAQAPAMPPATPPVFTRPVADQPVAKPDSTKPDGAKPEAAARPVAAVQAPRIPAAQRGETAPPAPQGEAPVVGVDLPLEPGSGAPRLRPPAPGAAPMGGSKADFIAAARRAAQAATESSVSGPVPAEDKPRSLLARLRGKVTKPKAESVDDVAPARAKVRVARDTANLAPPVAAAAPIDPMIEKVGSDMEQASIGSRLAANRRTIIVGIAAALLVVAAGLSTISNLRQKPAEDGATPPAPSTVAPQGKIDTQPAPIASAEARQVSPSELSSTLLSPAATQPPAELAPAAPALAPQDDNSAPATTGSVPSSPRGLPLGTSVSPAGWQSVGRAGERQSTIPAPLKTAAEGGNPAAAFELGTRYLEGRGVAVSATEAAGWYQRAADAGLAPAQYRLGSLYEKGTGVARDLPRARGLYEKAAEAGNGKAMHNLAVMFAQGALSERPDYRTAAQWFRRAADFGVADSQFNLGILYARGLGVDQSLAESYKWFALAALGGDQDAAKKRDEVAGRLDAQTLVAVRLAVQTFTAKPEPETAVRVTAPAGGWGDEPRAAATTPPPPRRQVHPVSSR